jgi:hypothetical protein
MTAAVLETPAEPVTSSHPHRITRDRHHTRIAAGVCTKTDRVLLRKGQPVEILTGYSARETAAAVLTKPDLTTVRGTLRADPERPFGHDVVLWIEVSDSSVAVDSGEVLESYAQNANPGRRIVHVPQRRIEVDRSPQGGTCAEKTFDTLEPTVPVVVNGREAGPIRGQDVVPCSVPPVGERLQKSMFPPLEYLCDPV